MQPSILRRDHGKGLSAGYKKLRIISNLQGSFTAEAVGTIEQLAEATASAPQVLTIGFPLWLQ